MEAPKVGDADRENSSSSDSDSDSEEAAAEKKARERREEIRKLKLELAGKNEQAEEEERERKKKGREVGGLEAMHDKYAHLKRTKGQKSANVMDKLKLFTNKLRAQSSGQHVSANSDSEEDKPARKKKKKTAEEERLGTQDVAPELGTFASMWDEGDEEVDADWCSGELKFAVDSTRAYALDQARAKKSLEVFDPLTQGDNKGKFNLEDERQRRNARMKPSIGR